MGARYKMSQPAEPMIGAVVESVKTGTRYQRLSTSTERLFGFNDGWFVLNADGQPDMKCRYGWGFILDAHGELEDVTPEKVWRMPTMPDAGTAVITPLEATGYARIWSVRQDREGSETYFWTPSISRSMLELLQEYGEIREWKGEMPEDYDLDAWVVRP